MNTPEQNDAFNDSMEEIRSYAQALTENCEREMRDRHQQQIVRNLMVACRRFEMVLMYWNAFDFQIGAPEPVPEPQLRQLSVLQKSLAELGWRWGEEAPEFVARLRKQIHSEILEQLRCVMMGETPIRSAEGINTGYKAKS